MSGPLPRVNSPHYGGRGQYRQGVLLDLFLAFLPHPHGIHFCAIVLIYKTVWHSWLIVKASPGEKPTGDMSIRAAQEALV